MNVTSKTIYYLCLALSGLLLLNLARLTVSNRFAPAGRTSKPFPYMAVLKENVYGASGNVRPGLVNTWAVRGDGSVVDQTLDRHGDKLTIYREILYSSGLSVRIDDIAGLRSSTVQPHTRFDWLRDPRSKCMNSLTGVEFSTNSVYVREERLGKFDTAVVKLGSLTLWYALDHGCALVKAINDFGPQGRSEQLLVSLAAGEPPRSLFQVPAYFDEVTPSRLMGACGPRTAAALKERDALYEKRRPSAAMLEWLDGLVPERTTGAAVR